MDLGKQDAKLFVWQQTDKLELSVNDSNFVIDIVTSASFLASFRYGAGGHGRREGDTQQCADTLI